MNHWNMHAKQWKHIGEPLRPSSADIQIISSWIPGMIEMNSSYFNVLLLGVTPELAAIAWPAHTRLYVVDANMDMIKQVFFNKKLSLKPYVSRGNWLHLPFPKSSMDLVIGDGCFSMLSADNYNNLVNEISRVLKPEKYCCMRFFIRPDVPESIEEIYIDFILKNIDNFHILKWRIAMALHGKLNEGVCLHDIWDIWNRYFKNNLQYLSWSGEIINTIEVYKNNPAIYTFPRLSELNTYFDKKFKNIEIYRPTYTLGDRCPVFKLQTCIQDD